MAIQVRSQNELYLLYRDEVQAQDGSLTDFEEGSVNDILAGGMSTGVSELSKLIQEEFAKTFFGSASGPEDTGDADDLENLAVDHFGDDFARPEASKAQGIVTFSRPTNGAGDVVIPALTIVKTPLNANGEAQSFRTQIAVTLVGLTINASVEAVEAGTKGNVEANEVTIIESALTDPTITVDNIDAFGGGEAAEDDATYRQTIKNLIRQLRGATIGAIEARALTVPGIEKATGIEFEQTVIEWDVANELPIGEAFKIPRAKLYVADANGSANDALVETVQTGILEVRGGGVRVDVIGATALVFNWTAQLTLNAGGPNFVALGLDASPIEDSMQAFVQGLPIGSGFDRILARAAILAQWGPAGSNDLTDFQTIAPTGNVVTGENIKLIPGAMVV